MVEFLRHAVGLCGEHFHPSLLSLLVAGVGLTGVWHWLRSRL